MLASKYTSIEGRLEDLFSEDLPPRLVVSVKCEYGNDFEDEIDYFHEEWNDEEHESEEALD